MLACTASMVVTTIVIGVLLWAILTISRDTVPFGVSVPADRLPHFPGCHEHAGPDRGTGRALDVRRV